MRARVCIAAALFCCLLAGFSIAGCVWPELIEGYQKNARSPMFTAFVTLGSFLLTIKTTILQRLKDGFDSSSYAERYLYLVGDPPKEPKPYYYSSLRNMSVAIGVCVPLALLSSAAQMTLGFVRHNFAFAICAALPATTLLTVLYLWFEITRAHRYWLERIEIDKQQQLFP